MGKVIGTFSDKKKTKIVLESVRCYWTRFCVSSVSICVPKLMWLPHVDSLFGKSNYTLSCSLSAYDRQNRSVTAAK